MDIARTAVWTVTIIILAITIGSGPIVSSLELPPENPNRNRMACDISGSVDVEVKEFPTDSFVFSNEEFGSDSYTLQSDPLIIDPGNVVGCPLVSFELRVPELGIFSFKNYYPTQNDEGTVAMSIVTTTYEQDRIRAESYDARVDVKVTGNTNRTLVTENITIPVED